MFFSNRMESTGQRGLDVAEQGVHPIELWMPGGLPSAASHDRYMPTTGTGDGGEAGQPIREDCRIGRQAGTGITRDLALAEAADATQVYTLGPTVLRRLNGGDERDFVIRPAATLAGLCRPSLTAVT